MILDAEKQKLRMCTRTKYDH